MATKVEGIGVARLVESGIERQQDWLDPLAEQLQGALTTALEQGGPAARKVKDFLNGTWLGHSLHPVLSDAPLGAWFTGALLDLAGSRRGADTAITIGVLSAVPTALAGAADWHDQAGAPRRIGLAHALLNSAGLLCFIASLFARSKGDRALGVGLSTAGLTLASGAAYLGGELVFARGVGVDRGAWDPEAREWQVAAHAEDVVAGQLAKGEIEVEGTKLPLVLLKQGQRILALGGTCAHMGGPLAEGKLDGQCVTCPWHGSTFNLEDGTVVTGPSAYPQPAYEARERNGSIEVRLKQ